MAGYTLLMKIIFTLVSFFITFVSLYANENWIKIEPIHVTKTPKQKQEVQIEPVNKMIKNVALIQQIINTTNKKKEQIGRDKNWFVLGKEKSN